MVAPFNFRRARGRGRCGPHELMRSRDLTWLSLALGSAEWTPDGPVHRRSRATARSPQRVTSCLPEGRSPVRGCGSLQPTGPVAQRQWMNWTGCPGSTCLTISLFQLLLMLPSRFPVQNCNDFKIVCTGRCDHLGTRVGMYARPGKWWACRLG